MPIPKYAELENERRFLVDAVPDLAGSPFRLIEDIYVTESRLRLRAVTHPDGAREFKFCKKYESADPVSGPIVNIYLSAAEHETLSRLPGRPLRKRRYRLEWSQRAFGVDVFHGDLAGLILCEAEADSPEAVGNLSFPPWASREVTADPFFTGGRLATVSAHELGLKLSDLRAGGASRQ